MLRYALLAAVAAASFAVPAAQARETCTPTALAGACVQVTSCPDACFVDPYVRTYCGIQNPPSLLCDKINHTVIRPLGR
jgi:hypothetical protein